MGTSISTSASRMSSSTAALAKLGASGTASRNKLEGRCVNTMVRTNPIRRASHAAPRWESALKMRTTKNRSPNPFSFTPKRSKNQ